MRFVIIFVLTIVGLVGIMFYEPKLDDKLLSVFEDTVTIDYKELDESKDWTYEINNDSLKEVSHDDTSFVFESNNDGMSELVFYYQKSDDDYKYKVTYSFEVKDNKIYWREGKTEGLMDFPKVY